MLIVVFRCIRSFTTVHIRPGLMPWPSLYDVPYQLDQLVHRVSSIWRRTVLLKRQPKKNINWTIKEKSKKNLNNYFSVVNNDGNQHVERNILNFYFRLGIFVDLEFIKELYLQYFWHHCEYWSSLTSPSFCQCWS
jgi:hypothetical protein